ncbi:MAG: hypothetical protein IJW51_03305 [Clostridia bacterium]|nr:hypothetical protein [Clostridia bacterium]
MQDFLRTQRAFCYGTAILTLIATVLRTLSLVCFTDTTGTYFTVGAPLPTIMHIVLALFALALTAYPLIALKGRVTCERAEKTPYSTAGAALCALLCFLNFICAATVTNAMLPGVLRFFALLTLLAATVYFILQTPVTKVSVTTLTVLGSLAIVSLACLVSLTYFDITTPMNAPHKTDLHLALLAAMLYLLYELRHVAGIPLPRALTACSGLAFFLAATVGFSDVTAYLCGIYTDPLYLAQDLLLLALAVYIGARMTADAALPSPTTKGQDTAA